MDLFKVRKFRRARKPEPEQESEGKPVRNPEEHILGGGCGGDDLSKTNNAKSVDVVDVAAEAEEEEDDDFITNEVKRRLKELRRNSFMVPIPEEVSFAEQEAEEEDDGGEAGDAICGEWRDVEAEVRQWWGGFDAVYDKYCDRMLFFDRLGLLQLKENGCYMPTTPSPKSSSKKLPSPFRCLSLKKFEDAEDEMEHLQQPQNDPYQDLETAYVAQMCLTWEALHCQYTQLSQRISCQPENPTSYNHSAQQFQQFQVLLQRFIENEPFEQGFRAEVFARSRKVLPRLLQAPNAKGSNGKDAQELDSDSLVHAQDLIRVIESSILTFHLFVKMDKKKSNAGITLFGNQNQIATPLQMIQSLIDKKKIRLKELCKKSKGWKKKTWPQSHDAVQLLFGLIDIKIVSRVLRMIRISKEQLIWCEDKMKKLNLADSKLQRDPSPILFPCQS